MFSVVPSNLRILQNKFGGSFFDLGVVGVLLSFAVVELEVVEGGGVGSAFLSYLAGTLSIFFITTSLFA